MYASSLSIRVLFRYFVVANLQSSYCSRSQIVYCSFVYSSRLLFSTLKAYEIKVSHHSLDFCYHPHIHVSSLVLSLKVTARSSPEGDRLKVAFETSFPAVRSLNTEYSDSTSIHIFLQPGMWSLASSLSLIVCSLDSNSRPLLLLHCYSFRDAKSIQLAI